MHHIFFIRSSVHGHLGGFHAFVIVSSAAVEHRGEALNFFLNSSYWTDHLAELTILRHLCFQPNTLILSSQGFGKFYPSQCQQHPGSTSATPLPRCRTLLPESHLPEPLSESEILCVHFTHKHKESAPAHWAFRSRHAAMSMHKFSFPFAIILIDGNSHHVYLWKQRLRV